jgi:hypothetical protein
MQNRLTYLKPPSFQEVSNFVKETGVSVRQFERYFGIPTKMVERAARGAINLPTEYWHIVYERIIPTYGTEPHKPMLKKEKKKVPVIKPKQTLEHHPRIDRLLKK